METDISLLNIEDYLKYISKDGEWAEELEKYGVEEIYNINITDYIQNYGNNEIYYQFFSDCNHDQNYRKHLCILTNINNNQYNLLFDKKYNCFKNNENRLNFLYNSLMKIWNLNKKLNSEYKDFDKENASKEINKNNNNFDFNNEKNCNNNKTNVDLVKKESSDPNYDISKDSSLEYSNNNALYSE